MKILITNYYLEKHAGTELFTKDIALFLKEKGHDVYVFSSRLGNVAREVETAGIPVSDNLLDFSKIDFDIIHAQHNICALEARSVFPLTPMVYMCHGVMPELEKPASINLAINYYLVVSEETRDYLINNFGISKNIISIVRNFVDLAKFSLLRNPNSSVKKILYLSNRPTPGVEENIKKACENLRISYRHVGLPDNPVFDVAAAINDSDLVISLGRGALEALACGRNVIVYDYLGFDGLVSVKNYKEIRKCNFSGRRYAKKVTPSQLMEEIEKYSLVSAEKMRDFVKKNHNKTTNLRQIEVIYEKVVADKKTHNSLFSVPYREIRWLDRSLAAAELDNENMRTILTLTRGELSVLTGEKENLSLKYEEIISSRGWKALEYFRSVRYPKKFAYTTYKLFIKITKKILPKFVFKGIKNVFIYFRELRADFKLKNELRGLIRGGDPIISIAIPVYDRTKELEEAIDSVFDQSFQDFEILLITDGSPSETLDVVHRYAKNPKVRVIEYPINSGNSVRGRNKAILEARGRYLAFLDSDDICLKNRLRDTVATFEKTDADVVYGGYEFMLAGGREISDVTDGQKVLPQKFDFEDLKKANYLFNSATAVRVDAIRKVGGLKPEMRYCEDYELWLRMMNVGAKFEPINKVVIKYRVHGGNLELAFKKDEKKWIGLSLKEYPKLQKLPKKIAYIIPTTGIGGGIAVACEHANRLQKRGYDLTFIIDPVYDDKYDLSWFPGQGIPLLEIGKASSEYDIAIATGWNTAHTLDIIKAKRKIYFVQSDERRFTDSSVLKSKIDKTYRMNYEFMTEANWIKAWLKREFNQDARVVPNALNEEVFFIDEPLEPKTDKLRVLLEGPIDIPFKGLADAFAVVKDLDCEVWCVSSCGKPKEGWRCDRFFEKVPQGEMRKIYSSCDVLLKLSRVEGFFGPPLEIMACGGTAVVGNVTGYDEYIVDRENALVVELEDLVSAKKAIQKLIDNRELLLRLQRAGIQTAKKMNWEKSIDTLQKLIEED